jgi:hypothetical protein
MAQKGIKEKRMKSVAFYKTYSGHEWIEASLESIYDTIDTIVVQHSDVSWKHERNNTVKPVVEKWKRENDVDNKIIITEFSSTSQDAQYQHGIDFIKNNLQCDLLLLIDSDEVWDSNVLRMGMIKARQLPNNAFRCSMKTYVKNPFYQVEPDELLKPMVFIKNISTFKGVRGGATPDAVLLPDIFFHHFTYVREDEDGILSKIEHSRDGENSHSVDLEWWIKEKWNKLPNVRNFHPHPQYQHSWQSIRQISIQHLPVSVRNKVIVKKYKR